MSGAAQLERQTVGPRYRRLSAALVEALGGAAVSIEQVGDGTALVDVALGIDSFDICGERLVAAVEDLGFTYVPAAEAEFPERRYFEKPCGSATACSAYRVHVYEVATRDAFLPKLSATL